MKNWILEKLKNLRTAQEAGKILPCPRCGRMSMKPDLHTNALSRCADIYICDECGLHEALTAYMKNPLQPGDWECMKVKDPFVADTIIPYLSTIEEQIPILKHIYREWLDDSRPSDFRAYRNHAQQNCPGVTELWTEPFQIEYKAKDGSRALIRFREYSNEILYSIDTFRA